MARGKTVMLFLMDGSVTGGIKCTLANWTGVVYRLPRTELNHFADREDLRQSGVYFLFGEDESDGRPMVYAGQAGIRKSGEGIMGRLKAHVRNPEMDYWTEAVVYDLE